jgi:hypothetical protein
MLNSNLMDLKTLLPKIMMIILTEFRNSLFKDGINLQEVPTELTGQLVITSILTKIPKIVLYTEIEL